MRFKTVTSTYLQEGNPLLFYCYFAIKHTGNRFK